MRNVLSHWDRNLISCLLGHPSTNLWTVVSVAFLDIGLCGPILVRVCQSGGHIYPAYSANGGHLCDHRRLTLSLVVCGNDSVTPSLVCTWMLRSRKSMLMNIIL